jgi:exosome complex RNA-binding protein Rrp4
MPRRSSDLLASFHAVSYTDEPDNNKYLKFKFCSGHGTYVDNDEVISSVAGTVERVNKLITVRAARNRYGGRSEDMCE